MAYDLTIPAESPCKNTTLDGRPFALRGQYVTLEGLSEHHMPSLLRNLDDLVWTWLPWSAPSSEEELWKMLEEAKRHGFILYAIKGDPSHVNPWTSKTPEEQNRTEILGTIGYLDVRPQHRSIETGGLLFGPKLRRTTAATEAHYLLLRNVCEPPGGSPPYRRIAWKCNKLNVASRRAAERLGYVFEGTTRNHLIFEGVSRDSDWFSIVIDEWPVVKKSLESWMEGENFDEYGKQRRKLEAIRAGCK